MHKRPIALSIALALATASGAVTDTAAAADATQASKAMNPFFHTSPLPYQFPQFDKITNADYVPAFEEGMKQGAAEIEKIANNREKPTFENTIVAMEKSGEILDRVSTVFYSLVGTNTNDEMQAIQAQMAPKLSAYSDAISLNEKLYARVKALYDQIDELGLDPESKRLLERYHTDFVRAGAQLSAEDKAKVKDINAQMATLQTQFSQNVLKEVNAAAIVVDSKDDLKGMSDSDIAAAAAVAKARGMEGKYVIALLNTSGQPALDSISNRALRERIQKASIARGSQGGEFDNREIFSKIAKLRAQRAAIMGYANHAEYVLEDATAKTTDAVNKMLFGLAPAAVANAKKEAADMQKVAQAEDKNLQLQAWDWSYYAEKVRAERYAFDESQLRPYFEMNNVLENGVFYAAEKLYGLTFKKRTDLPLYHEDTAVYEVFDADGKHLALFIADMYARGNKRGGAWMNAYVSQNGLTGTTPVVANHLNVPKPPKGEPTLLTFDEVTTMFHEFGHALHGMFSNVKYPRFAGTSVPRDFVEYPSQVNEMWATDPAILSNYAKHYQTGAQIPQALLDKVQAAAQFNEGFRTTEYLAASIIDQAWHQKTVDELPDADGVLAFEANALDEAGIKFPLVPPRYRTTYFSHIVGGYSAGYYSYLWSEVLDADSVEWFKENGGLKRENGDHFRKTLLSRGGSEDAMKIFEDFRGRAPDIQPLLKRRGLTATPETE